MTMLTPIFKPTDGELLDEAHEASATPARSVVPTVIVLIHDRPLVRDGVASLIEGLDRNVWVRKCASLAEIDDPEISLAIIWIDTPGPEGCAKVRRRIERIRERFPDCPVIGLVQASDPDVIRIALHQGLTLVSFRTATQEIALAAIRLALAGARFTSSELLAGQVFEADPPDRRDPVSRAPTWACEGRDNAPILPNHDPRFDGQRFVASLPSKLTARELEILDRIDRGLQNKTIAYELGISSCTVKVHVQNIMKKMHARNRTQVAFLARRQ